MQPLTLYRAVAYRLQRANTAPSDRWPDMAVFFEAASRDDANHKLPVMLALAWDCRPADVEFYNLASQDELVTGACFGDFKEMGDAALLCNGWSHGPLFCRADRTLMLVSPPMLARLQLARRLAHPFWLAQRSAESALAEQARMQANHRHVAQRERMEGAHATGFGSL